MSCDTAQSLPRDNTMARKIRSAQLTAHRPDRVDYDPGTPRLLQSAEGARYRLLAGPAPALPDDLVGGLVLTDAETIAAAVRLGTTSPAELTVIEKIQLAIALADDVKATALCLLLGERNHPEVWRWTALKRAAQELRGAVLSGSLTRGHARPLLPLPSQLQAEWTRRALRGRWSVRTLTSMVAREGKAGTPATPSPAAADTKHLEDQLSQRLGSPVRLEWPEAPGTRSLIIGYSDMETLKGVLQELARGPEGTGHLGNAMRSLRIELADADELDALTGHLLSE